MSNESAVVAELSQELIAQSSPELTANYVALSATALVLYDYLLTLPLELLLIWRGKVNLIKVFFVLNRYFGFLSIYSNMFLCFVKPVSDVESRCQIFYYLQEVPSILSDIAIYSIFTLRTYAIYGKRWLIFFVVAIPALVDVASTIWSTVVQTTSALPRELQVGPWTCNFSSTSSIYAAIMLNSISIDVFDVTVVIQTVYRTFRLAKQSRKSDIRGLSYILLRDGTVFYLFVLQPKPESLALSINYSVIFVPTFAYVVLNAIILKNGSATVSFVSQYFITIISTIRIVAVNRLVLSLSYEGNARDDSEYRTRTSLEPPMFATNSLLGNFGGLVRSIPDSFDGLEETSGSQKSEGK